MMETNHEPAHDDDFYEPVEFYDAGIRWVSVESAILLGGMLIGLIVAVWHLA